MNNLASWLLRSSIIVVCAFALSPLALADESDCQTGAYACSNPSSLDFTYSGPGSPCTAPPPAAPGDPIYTYASRRTGGFTGEGAAAIYGAEGYACQHPVGSAVNGGIVCEIVGPRAAGPWQTVSTWDGTLPAFQTRAYDWVVKVLEGPAGSQTCTRETSLGYSISRGNGLSCAPNYQRGFSTSGLGFCWKALYCPHCPFQDKEGNGLLAVGNPISVGDAEKLLVESDFRSPDGGLEIVRYFNSQTLSPLMGEAPDRIAPFGSGWSSRYH